MEKQNTFEMAKVYSPKDMEDRIYKMWEESGAFKPKMVKGKKPFTIVMPPPNITGQLHVGHALDEMPQDVLIRYHRMKGDPTLWVPGTDHAAIATEVKVVEALAKEGLTKKDLGREKFLERTWDWKKEYGGRIVKQLRKLGVSCDWSRERFTMDEGLSRAVRETFVRLYEKGLIYQGWRMINWCPCCKTSISDAEVEYESQDGSFWHLLYPVKETGEMLELATTRPETMLGDTAVAINAEDERYAHLHGCHVILPLINKEIPIVCDEHADMTKGTGVVKITPAHDPNDYEVGKRHNLPMVRVFTYDGHMTGAKEAAENAEWIASGRATKDEPMVLDCGKYAGMTALEARKAILADLDAIGAAAGVCCLCRKRGKKVNIVIDKDVNAAGPVLELLRPLPEYRDCFISGQEALLTADAKSLLIVVDTNRPDQVESKPLLESIRRVVVIDHHRRAADYIEQVVLNLHEPFASSASELVTELLQYAVETQDILMQEAAALLAGIVLDTKNFGVRTSSRTFEAAAFLRRIGADTVEVKKLFQNDLPSTIARYKIIQNAKLYRDHIAISALDYTATRTIAAQAADELLNISGIDTSFVLYPQDDQTIISARSIGDANVQVILEPLGGGGNAATAGAQVKNHSVPETLEELVQSIDRFYEN